MVLLCKAIRNDTIPSFVPATATQTGSPVTKCDPAKDAAQFY